MLNKTMGAPQESRETSRNSERSPPLLLDITSSQERTIQNELHICGERQIT
jgi:hypothetical protein